MAETGDLEHWQVAVVSPRLLWRQLWGHRVSVSAAHSQLTIFIGWFEARLVCTLTVPSLSFSIAVAGRYLAAGLSRVLEGKCRCEAGAL